jgi:hypothetical protein
VAGSSVTRSHGPSSVPHTSLLARSDVVREAMGLFPLSIEIPPNINNTYEGHSFLILTIQEVQALCYKRKVRGFEPR